MPVILTTALRKQFGGFVAVKDLSFQVDEGASFGLLGPNGAGKSTLIRLLTTLVSPTSGEAVVAGSDVQKRPGDVRRSIGVIPQALTSDPDLTAAENLNFYACLQGLPRSRRRRFIEEVLDMVDLVQWRDKLVGTFSGGMRRRLEIGRSLLHKPKILFLDEPTTGLDPASRLAMWDTIRRLKEESQLTLFLTTHYMEEADHLCDMIGIFDHGEIIVQGTPEELKHLLVDQQLIEATFGAIPPSWEETVLSLPEVTGVEVTNGHWRIGSTDCMRSVAALFDASREARVGISGLSIRKATLEDVFVKYTGRQLRDAPKSSFTREVGHIYERGG